VKNYAVWFGAKKSASSAHLEQNKNLVKYNKDLNWGENDKMKIRDGILRLFFG
jgi:hypothetical protein